MPKELGKTDDHKLQYRFRSEKELYCAQYNRNPSVSTNVSSHVLCHRVRTWELPSKVVGFWVGAHGWKPREKEHSPV